DDIVVIARQALEDIRRELASRGLEVTFAQEVAEFLVDKLPPGESVRPLRGVIREHIEDPLSLEILAHGSEDPLLVTIEDGTPVFARPVPLVCGPAAPARRRPTQPAAGRTLLRSARRRGTLRGAARPPRAGLGACRARHVARRRRTVRLGRCRTATCGPEGRGPR